jgi:prevent-host-death family protein
MKSATIREVQHNLGALLRQVEIGEEIEIRRRNQPVARIVSVRTRKPKQVKWSDVGARLKQMYGERMVPGTPLEDIVSEGRGLL